MAKRALVATALALGMALGTAGQAAAQTAPPGGGPGQPPAGAQNWKPVFYFGAYCEQAGMFGQQTGILVQGGWKCDRGWMLVPAPSA